MVASMACCWNLRQTYARPMPDLRQPPTINWIRLRSHLLSSQAKKKSAPKKKAAVRLRRTNHF